MPEWISKTIDVLKIPTKILLPALWIFSGSLLLLNDNVLDKFFLLSWRDENGFIIGLTFLICSCLIVVYICYYLKEKASDILFKITLKKKTLKRLINMSSGEKHIVARLYKAKNYNDLVDYNNALTQALLGEKVIFIGSNRALELDLNNTMLVDATLQPYVYNCLNYYKPRIKRQIDVLENKTVRTEKENEKLGELKEFYKMFYK